MKKKIIIEILLFLVITFCLYLLSSGYVQGINVLLYDWRDSSYTYIDTLKILTDKLDTTNVIGMEQLYDVDTSYVDKYDIQK